MIVDWYDWEAATSKVVIFAENKGGENSIEIIPKSGWYKNYGNIVYLKRKRAKSKRKFRQLVLRVREGFFRKRVREGRRVFLIPICLKEDPKDKFQ